MQKKKPDAQDSLFQISAITYTEKIFWVLSLFGLMKTKDTTGITRREQMEDKYKLIAFHYFVSEAIEMNEELNGVLKPLAYAAAWFMCENIVKGDYFAQGLEFETIEKSYNFGKVIYENLIKGSSQSNTLENLFDGSKTPDEILDYAKSKGYIS